MASIFLRELIPSRAFCSLNGLIIAVLLATVCVTVPAILGGLVVFINGLTAVVTALTDLTRVCGTFLIELTPLLTAVVGLARVVLSAVVEVLGGAGRLLMFAMTGLR